MNRFIGLGTLAGILACGLVGSTPARAQDTTEQGLKSLAEPLFGVGVGVSVRITDNPGDQGFLRQHFEYVTPENCMKVASLQNTPGDMKFDAPDRFVQFAVDNDLKIVGHCLVWAKDDRTPAWFYQDGEAAASADVLLGRMKEYIQTVVGRYKGKIAMWDVVNEALGDGEEDYLRDSGWTRATGEDFLVKAFEYAHAADPDAFLIYNDYRCDTEGKREKLMRLVKMFKDRGAPVDAIGLQGHYELDSVPFEGLEAMFQGLREAGLKVVVSELDIDVVKRGRWWADDGAHREEMKLVDPYKDGCPEDVLQRQAEQYAKLFRLFAKYSDVIHRVSFWNLHDGTSWLNSFPWDRVNHPLLFDRQKQPKPAYHAVVDVLQAAKNER